MTTGAKFPTHWSKARPWEWATGPNPSIIHPVMVLSVRCPTPAPLLFVALAYCMCANASNEASAIYQVNDKAPAIPRRLR